MLWLLAFQGFLQEGSICSLGSWSSTGTVGCKSLLTEDCSVCQKPSLSSRVGPVSVFCVRRMGRCEQTR